MYVWYRNSTYHMTLDYASFHWHTRAKGAFLLECDEPDKERELEEDHSGGQKDRKKQLPPRRRPRIGIRPRAIESSTCVGPGPVSRNVTRGRRAHLEQFWVPPTTGYAVGWITISVVEAGWIVSAIFLAVLAVVVVAVIRGLWRIWRGDPELEAGGSWGRQLFGGRRQTM